MTTSLVDKTLASSRKGVVDAGLRVTDITGVVMVGSPRHMALSTLTLMPEPKRNGARNSRDT